MKSMMDFADRHEMLPPGATILCAVSGGADSVCLLHLLCTLAPSRGLTLWALHFNHRLRGAEADRDEAFVRALCEKLGVRLLTGSADVAAYAAENGLGTEEAARELRYRFFEQAAAPSPNCRVATAHNAEDNAETMLMHLARGSGLRGLGGIPPVRGRYIRPLLHTTRGEILRYLAEHSLSFVEDSTNADEHYMRNRVRRSILPLMRELNPAFVTAAADCAERLREDEAYLQDLAAQAVPITEEGQTHVLSAAALAAAPTPLAARAVCEAAARQRTNLSAAHVRAVLSLASAKAPSARLSLPGGGEVCREYDRLIFSPAPARAAFLPARELVWRTWLEVPEAGFRLWWGPAEEKIAGAKRFRFKKSDVCGKMIVRARQSGDRICLDRRQGSKSLKKLFIEKKIPARRRGLVPVIADDKGVLAVVTLGIHADRLSAGEADCAICIQKTKLAEGAPAPMAAEGNWL